MFGGIGAEIAARLTERCFYSLSAPPLRIGGYHTPYPPSRVEEDYLPERRPAPRRARPRLRVLASRGTARVPPARRRRGTDRGRDRDVEGRRRRHRRAQPAARRHRDREGDGRAAEPLRGDGRPRCSPTPGQVVDVGSAIISIEVDGAGDVRHRPPPSTSCHGGRCPRRAPPCSSATGSRPRRAPRRGGTVAVALPPTAPPAPPSTPASTHAHRPTVPPRSAPSPAMPAVPHVAPRSTPPVRKLAKALQVDLAAIRGHGRDGLITRDDVERAAACASRAHQRFARPSGPTRFAGIELAGWDDGPAEERIAVRGVLRSMAEAMMKSAFTAPHAAAWVKVDATRTMELVASLRERPALEGVKLTPLTIVALGVCHAARANPGINSSFDDAARRGRSCDASLALGIAAATDRGPHRAEHQGCGPPRPRRRWRVRSTASSRRPEPGRRCRPTCSGTTLTITNVGPFGIDGAVPILPPGTARDRGGRPDLAAALGPRRRARASARSSSSRCPSTTA